MSRMPLFLVPLVSRATFSFRWYSVSALGLVLMFTATASAGPSIPGFGAGPITRVGATSYDFVVVGDATGYTVQGTNPLYNSFADPSKNTNPSAAGASVTYDPNTNTSLISFYGAPATALPAGPPQVTAWFGVDYFPGQVLKQYWDVNGVQVGLWKPGGGFKADAADLADFQYAVLRGDLTSDAGDVFNMWNVVPVPAGGTATVTFTAGDLDLTLSHVGYFLSNSPVLMTTLSATYPDPGQPGSPFTPLAALEGLHLAAHQSISGITLAVPEPGSFLLGMAGVLAFASAFSRRRRSGNAITTRQ